MQQHVENFDFNFFYPKEFRTSQVALFALPEIGKNPSLIKSDERTVKDCINLSSKVYSHRALNLVLAHYIFDTVDINPNMMMRFDTRIVNDICTFRMGSQKRALGGCSLR
jgi:hypothetical protein